MPIHTGMGDGMCRRKTRSLGRAVGGAGGRRSGVVYRPAGALHRSHAGQEATVYAGKIRTFPTQKPWSHSATTSGVSNLRGLACTSKNYPEQARSPASTRHCRTRPAAPLPESFVTAAGRPEHGSIGSTGSSMSTNAAYCEQVERYNEISMKALEKKYGTQKRDAAKWRAILKV